MYGHKFNSGKEHGNPEISYLFEISTEIRNRLEIRSMWEITTEIINHYRKHVISKSHIAVLDPWPPNLEFLVRAAQFLLWQNFYFGRNIYIVLLTLCTHRLVVQVENPSPIARKCMLTT